MPNPLHIIPECYVDTNLVSTLLGGIGVNHQKSCNNVVALMKGKFEDDFAVGIIDNDKRRPQYLNECTVLAESEHLCLYKHSGKHHYIITVSPAAEAFILSAVDQAHLSMQDYGLPSGLNEFKKITKHIVTNKSHELVRLFQDLSPVGEFKLLGNVLNYLLKKGFAARQDEVTAFFQEYSGLSEIVK